MLLRTTHVRRTYIGGAWNICLIFSGFWVYGPIATELSTALTVNSEGRQRKELYPMSGHIDISDYHYKFCMGYSCACTTCFGRSLTPPLPPPSMRSFPCRLFLPRFCAADFSNATLAKSLLPPIEYYSTYCACKSNNLSFLSLLLFPPFL